MNKTTIKAALVGSALLLSTSLTSAQTTVTGDIVIGLKAFSTDGTKAQSSRNMTKETQINLQTKGPLPNGMSYAAGMSVEYDGTDTGAVAMHTENNYIDIISGSTTLSLSADHMPNGNYSITNIAGTHADIDDVVDGVANGTVARMLGPHGASGAFGLGIIQDFGVAKASYFYAPSNTNSPLDSDGGGATLALSGVANSFHEVTTRGNFGVKGLDAGIVFNTSQATQTVAGANNDITNLLFSLKYTLPMGLAAAAEHSEQEDAAGTAIKTRALGIGYALTKDATIGYQVAKTSISTALTTDEKIQGISIGYNLGPVALNAVFAKVDNIGNPLTTAATAGGKAALFTAQAKF